MDTDIDYTTLCIKNIQHTHHNSSKNSLTLKLLNLSNEKLTQALKKNPKDEYKLIFT